MRYLPVFIIMAMMTYGCSGSSEPVPRPRAYPRIEYPPRNFVPLESAQCPFSFSYPDYMRLEMRTTYLQGEPVHPCWFDLIADQFNARIHFSYYPLGDENEFNSLVDDAFTLANKINQRSNYMDEIRIGNAQGASGLVLEFTGPAASPMHFFLSDSTTHFLKGALYFNTAVRPDSLSPVIEFVQTDIARIMNSFTWK